MAWKSMDRTPEFCPECGEPTKREKIELGVFGGTLGRSEWTNCAPCYINRMRPPEFDND